MLRKGELGKGKSHLHFTAAADQCNPLQITDTIGLIILLGIAKPGRVKGQGSSSGCSISSVQEEIRDGGSQGASTLDAGPS